MAASSALETNRPPYRSPEGWSGGRNRPDCVARRDGRRSETAERGHTRWGLRVQISVLPRPKRALHQQYLPAAHLEEAPLGARSGGSIRASRKTAAAACGHFCAIWHFSGLLLIVFKVYRIEERAYQGASVSDPGHARFSGPARALPGPFRFKKPLFVAISMAGLFWVFGGYLAAIVLGFATVLIGVCFLPIRWSAAPESSPRSRRPAPSRGREP